MSSDNHPFLQPQILINRLNPFNVAFREKDKQPKIIVVSGVTRIIEQIRQQNALLAEALAELVKNCRFDTLQTLFEQGKNGSPARDVSTWIVFVPLSV